MATLKHLSSKNADYGAAEQYLTFEHDEFTGNVNDFLKLVKSYIEPEQLTPEILHMFVDKIVVHEGDNSNGHRIQQVDIYYNFVGHIDMSVEKVETARWQRDTAQTSPGKEDI